jgi:hypothetical protein
MRMQAYKITQLEARLTKIYLRELRADIYLYV